MSVVKLCTLGVITVGLIISARCHAESCSDLKSLDIAGTEIENAMEITQALPQLGKFASKVSVPFCRVVYKLVPTPDSNINGELWLPSPEKWNGKFLGTGNGGAAGAIIYPYLVHGVEDGYATTNTDLGSSPAKINGTPGFGFGVGHPSKIDDWDWRATHLSTVVSKEIAEAYYGKGPRESYFTGCSNGGRSALLEAQRFPDDYNGIVSGDPSFDLAHMHIQGIWWYKATHDDPADYFPASKLQVLYKAQINACDAIDGVKDGIISEPIKCHFDPGTLTCKQGDGPDCFTPGQVTALRKIFGGPRNPRTGKQILPGPEPGALLAVNFGSILRFPADNGPIPPQQTLQVLQWAKDWKGPDFDFDHDMAAEDRDLDYLKATNPNLHAFANHGGKLLLYTGWADPLIPPTSVINYYNSVEKDMGGSKKTATFIRLFMVPGMGHCINGPGATEFDPLATLNEWVETGTPPDSILAKHSKGDHPFTRPLCPYPQFAKWNGSGSADDAANFACVNDSTKSLLKK